MEYDRYQKFRQESYQMLGKAKDATFELMDRIMTTRNASCLAEFSLSPLFRRKWSSIYEALQDSRPNRNKLMKRYIQEMPSLEYVLLGIDHTAWGRRGAKTLKDRTYEDQASSNNSVTVGQGYSTIAWLPEKQGSWALPLRHERITSYEKPISKACWQLKQVCKQIKQKVLGVDHWYRFAKQRLHWTLPSFSTAQQSERWSDLMPLMTWQLWLAKDLVEDYHLPWQSPQKRLTPGRVAQSVLPLLIEMKTPATSPKPRGKSPGWKTGQKRSKRKTYPIAKKSHSRSKKSKKEPA